MENSVIQSEQTELLRLAKQGNESAILQIIETYKPEVKKLSRQYFLVGGDEDDIIQEGMIGLYKAILSYDENNAANFKTFASLCVRRQLQSAIRGANRQKHKPLNEYLPIAINDDEESEEVGLILPAPNRSPEQHLLDKEKQEEFLRAMLGALSNFEKNVLTKYLKGYSYTEIAGQIKKPIKSVDNALLRIKKKLADL